MLNKNPQTPLTEKYKELIGAILNTSAFKVYLKAHDGWKPYDYVQIYEKENYPVEYIPFRYASGLYQVRLDNSTIVASFELVPMVNCCGVLVSTRAKVEVPFQHNGLGTVLNSLRIDIARELGYSVLLCTDGEKNAYQRKILLRNGWKDIFKFVNRRTGNTVAISVINL